MMARLQRKAGLAVFAVGLLLSAIGDDIPFWKDGVEPDLSRDPAASKEAALETFETRLWAWLESDGIDFTSFKPGFLLLFR